MNVFASAWSVAMQLALRFVALAWLWAAFQSSDRGWHDREVSFREALVSGVLYAGLMTGWTIVELVNRRKRARQCIGPRFDTDRRALREALRSGELPADPTLDGPLLTAIAFRSRPARHEIDLPPLANWLLMAAAYTVAVWLLGWWALLLILPLGIPVWRRRSRPPVDLDELRRQLHRRRGSDPGLLSYADLDLGD